METSSFVLSGDNPLSVHVTGAIILLEFLLSTFTDIFNYHHARAR